ncbi:MAG: hypothetical protein ACUVTL_06555 [Thermoproteota archaeon]
MMKAEGVDVSILGVARLYSNVASKIYIQNSDSNYIEEIEHLQMSVIATNILMKNILDSCALAQEILKNAKLRS